MAMHNGLTKKITKVELEKLYFEEKLTQYELAEKLHCSKRLIYSLLKRHGIFLSVDERRKRISDGLKKAYLENRHLLVWKGKNTWNKGTKGVMKAWNKGKPWLEETKRKMSEAQCGEKSFMWRGGISFEPYGLEFNNKLKEQIRKRDNYRCQECFRHQDELSVNTKAGLRKYKLHVHHIDFNKKNNNPSNLISLCKGCHAQTNYNRDAWTKYYQGKNRFGGDY